MAVSGAVLVICGASLTAVAGKASVSSPVNTGAGIAKGTG